MTQSIDCNIIPKYRYSSYRKFNMAERHITRFCEEDVLIIMLDGILRFYEDGNAVELCKGEYYIQKKGLYQQGIEESNSPYYYYAHFLGHWTENSGIPYRGEYSPEVLKYVKKLDMFNTKGMSNIEKTAVFLQVLSLLKNNKENNKIVRLANEIAQIIQMNIKTGISVKDLATQLNYSENYIIKIFKTVYGKTPYAYFTDLRLNEVNLKLKYSDLTLSEIATECGFKDYVGLYKAYKKAYNKNIKR